MCNDNRFVIIIAETNTRRVIDSKENGTNMFHYSFRLSLRDAGFKVEIRSPAAKGFCLRQLLYLSREILYHQVFPI